jgi:hypothetical protein
MSRRWQTCILCSASIALLVFATKLILVSRASTESERPTSNKLVQPQRPNKNRNLVLQPEAAAVNRRVGNRFRSTNARSVVVGTLTLGSNRQSVTIIRSQTDNGENVEVIFPGRTFSWSGAEGVKAIQDAAATEAEHLAVERLVFDSPDQFVLAQLRGASYQTIARNLRPIDAGDDYPGPLWTMVRVNDPQKVEAAAPKSLWRLYYINSISGLIDRIESDVDGQRTAASILQWTEQNGEKIPSHIRWTMNGQALMEYQLASFSQGQ